MKTYTDEEKRKIVKDFNNRTVGSKQFCKNIGVSDYSVYMWKKKFGGASPTEVKVLPEESPAESPATGLEFNIVQDREAREWVKLAYRSGRFLALKEALITRVRGLRTNNALTFAGPKDGNLKEAHSIMHACYGAINKAELPFTIRYSKSRNIFIVLRREAA